MAETATYEDSSDVTFVETVSRIRSQLSDHHMEQYYLLLEGPHCIKYLQLICLYKHI